ncbi:cell wall assembly and cell proliferation coordinating protein [Teratosphaeria nubilosa]|uniref:Cell wall assembly and cell proliferation coordinating protein n=1 Tax=Teratosphaeria nubilosa TaxID=161662 RepID=A0A6G1L7M5_9PEZI|nr:cell wall assembly and cell proliferation coordinating protein [Teratosphaeria nubilosa]
MASSIAQSWRAFWHDLTSNDRHAGPEAPYRSNSHVPLPQSRRTPLTTNVTSPSAADLTYDQDLEAGNGFVSNGPGSPTSGIKKLQRQSSGMDAKMEGVGNGEIQMQAFSDGLPPPPPVSHSWKRIDRWMEDNYEELFENLGEPATVNDVNMLEHELDCTLPQEVRESLQIHDGQERGGMPTGVVFGCMLLDCEEIIQEWQNWRTVNEAYFNDQPTYEIPQAPIKAFSAGSSSAVPVAQSSQSANSQWRQELLDKQDSQPSNAIQKAYAHPAWIPLARDWGGNNICVDLAPGPTGKWGQVILMGRDYDCKYVVSRSWSAFLATLADDLSTDKWFIDEDTKELKLREFKQQSVEPAYIDILRWRADQKYGRKRPAKRPLHINSQVAGGGSNGLSPYQSPTGNDDRGRSPQRLANGKQPVTSSPRAHISSPLARVTEEPQPLKVDTNAVKPDKLVSVDTPQSKATMTPTTNNKAAVSENKLVSVESPRTSGEEEKRSSNPPLTKSRLSNSVLSSEEMAVVDSSILKEEVPEEGLGINGLNDEMKEVTI